MRLGSMDRTKDGKYILVIEFDDVNEAVDYCIEHEIKVSPKIFEEG